MKLIDVVPYPSILFLPGLHRVHADDVQHEAAQEELLLRRHGPLQVSDISIRLVFELLRLLFHKLIDATSTRQKSISQNYNKGVNSSKT